MATKAPKRPGGKAPARLRQEEMMRAKGYLTVAEVAGKLGRSVGAVYRLLREGTIEEMKVGYGRYVKAASLVRYLGRQAAEEFGFVARRQPPQPKPE